MMDMPDARAQAKITGKEGLNFNGTALVYDCEEDMLEALENGGTAILDMISSPPPTVSSAPYRPHTCCVTRSS